MLIRDDGETWTAIGQQAHAWLAGQLARAWDPAPEPAVVLAVEQHDVAWRELDRRPPLHADARRACSFAEVPLEQRLVAWSGAAAQLESADPYAAVLVSLHATNIHTRYARTWPEEFLAAQQADRDALLARLPHRRREGAARDAELLFCIDALSLAIGNLRASTELPPLDGVARTVTVSGAEVFVDPWPFTRDEVRVGLHERTFGERFADEEALHAAMDVAPFAWREWILRRRQREPAGG